MGEHWDLPIRAAARVIAVKTPWPEQVAVDGCTPVDVRAELRKNQEI
jgi:hypothetical protein